MTITATTTENPGIKARVKQVKFEITSASDGTASGTAAAEKSRTLNGEIVKCAIIPGSGDNQPTDLFDIEVQDSTGYDVLLGQGANLSNSDTTTIVGDMSAVVDDELAVVAAGMGDTKTATVIVYVR